MSFSDLVVCWLTAFFKFFDNAGCWVTVAFSANPQGFAGTDIERKQQHNNNHRFVAIIQVNLH